MSTIGQRRRNDVGVITDAPSMNASVMLGHDGTGRTNRCDSTVFTAFASTSRGAMAPTGVDTHGDFAGSTVPTSTIAPWNTSAELRSFSRSWGMTRPTPAPVRSSAHRMRSVPFSSGMRSPASVTPSALGSMGPVPASIEARRSDRPTVRLVAVSSYRSIKKSGTSKFAPLSMLSTRASSGTVRTTSTVAGGWTPMPATSLDSTSTRKPVNSGRSPSSA